MDGRKRLSGWQYKKVAEEKKKKLTEVVNKTAKLDTFFTRSNLPVPPEPVLLESVKEFCEVELEVCSILTPSASTASASVPSALTSTPPASASAPSASTSTPLASASAPPVSTSTPSASASTPSASPSTPSASAPSASSCVDTDKIKPAISELTFVVDEIEDQLTVSEPDSSVHLKPNYDPALWIPLPNCPVFAHKSTAMTDYGSKPAGTFTGEPLPSNEAEFSLHSKSIILSQNSHKTIKELLSLGITSCMMFHKIISTTILFTIIVILSNGISRL
ncbi:uncharacterized protein LOC126891454 [Diabrotica virgifera virgifera]|uniref:Flocculation protein FLO11-like n=1 Tax=Diabrotica virgifera virgifera TaxID=50390 RepID=A0ABM5L2D2_DIAVI|nr:uncharacterized protein LOC126891454 [Diabrotica virgifera virgifera]